MQTNHFRLLRLLPALMLATTLAACADETPLAPDQRPQLSAGSAQLNQALAELRRVTAPYHNVDAALADGFVLLHECETRDGEGVGTVYANFARVLDGVANPSLPDALIYEPAKNGRLTLVGVEFAIPYPLWTGTQSPEFFGNEFEREDEFGVFGLHAWVWRHNPNGMFAESNPRVSCDN
jgi:hypothetical protein